MPAYIVGDIPHRVNLKLETAVRTFSIMSLIYITFFVLLCSDEISFEQSLCQANSDVGLTVTKL